ncbi:30 kDa ribonucleoprotein, chloroplastic-like [Vigna radiata var. radiata]|uniref:30 kDa ribonucleoprotein, chloroplastic-like n=1 Tax=Vigna radiata var. radiata TaxID=3916 RepID=A0A1S3UY93_VIGRR|nr:30 kDa ribonucleoprotein, chloroplastic-like [Vigna radiata var. radiata]
MSTSATSLALSTLTLRTQHPLSSPKCFSSSLSLTPNAKPISISTVFLKPTFSLSSRFLPRVALSSDYDQQEDTFAAAQGFSPDLKLFVGNLPFSVDSAQLAELFESVGIVEVVEVIYDKTTGRSRGFGFVTMSTVEEVEAAVQQFNGYELDGRALRVNAGPPPARNESSSRLRSSNRGGGGGGGGDFSDNKNKVHVGNLAWGVDHVALESLFREQGNVVEARVVYDRDSGRSKGFGFVTYSSADEVSSAIESLDGVDLNGRAIRVSLADSKPKRF